jgi:hypothetical protein
LSRTQLPPRVRCLGFDRCLWGTDWTRAFAVVNYEQAVKPFLKTSRLSDGERAMLMGRACAKAYGWVAEERLGYSPPTQEFGALAHQHHRGRTDDRPGRLLHQL